jgi:hypothetical protein
MPYPISNSRETGYADSANSKYFVSGAVTGFDSLVEGLIVSTGESDPDGYYFEAMIRYSNPDYGSDWQLVTAKYNTGDDSLTVINTINSSNEGGAVNWDETGDEDLLVIYGTQSHNLILPLTLQDQLYQDFDNFSSTTTSSMATDMSHEIVITPTSKNSFLKIDNWRSYVWVQRPDSGNDLRGQLKPHWWDGSAWQPVGATTSFGLLNSQNVGTFQTWYGNYSWCSELDQSRLDDTFENGGVWRLRLKGNVLDAGANMTTNDNVIAYREVLQRP